MINRLGMKRFKEVYFIEEVYFSRFFRKLQINVMKLYVAYELITSN